MFTTIEDFARTWKQEIGFTQSVMDALTNESLTQAINEDHRTLGRMAWHIAMSIPEMMSRCGLDFGGADPEAPVPATAKEIAEAYQTHSQKLLAEVESKWQDATLQVEDEMYGETWKRGKTLHILLVHEIHHRGQMTVLMRQAGVVVPSIYGPAK
ncbi:MAG: DinB family protein [Candidatus Zixiibacteriota bacterium]|nr:MAG: DinB family protein [candidate division Zixibacteria bacterium]